jgi:DNA-binding XRE family transcriptional regulator
MFPIGNIKMTEKTPQSLTINPRDPDQLAAQSADTDALRDKAYKALLPNFSSNSTLDYQKLSINADNPFGVNYNPPKSVTGATISLPATINKNSDLLAATGLFAIPSGLSRPGRAPVTTQDQCISISTPKHLGTLIKASRVAKKLTQQQLADLAGVGRRFLIECEAGKLRLEFAKVLQVAAAVGIDIFAIKR